MAKDRRKSRLRAKQGDRRGGLLSMVIEPYFQIKLGAMLLVTNLVFGLLISGVVYYFIMDIHDAVRLYFQFTQEEALESWNKFLVPITVCLSLVGVFFLFTFFIIIRYTHQIYGPLVSIHQYIDGLLDNEASSAKLEYPLELRSSDQLVMLAHKLNRLAEKLGLAAPATTAADQDAAPMAGTETKAETKAEAKEDVKEEAKEEQHEGQDNKVPTAASAQDDTQ